MRDEIYKNQQGVALLMVLGAMVILTALMVDFSFETKVHKLRAYNTQERMQAKLNAEAGLMFAMVRLNIYQESLNFLERNKQYKKLVSSQIIDNLWSTPFMYPIPVLKDANILQRSALEEFQKNFLLTGKMMLTIQNVSHLLNINLLRDMSASTGTDADAAAGAAATATANTGANPAGSTTSTTTTTTATPAEKANNMQEKLTEILKTRIEEQREKARNAGNISDISDKFTQLTPELLVKLIKYYISKEDSFEDNDRGEIEHIYQKKEVHAKFAPLSSISELYLIPGLNDAVIDLIKDDFTVHGVTTVDFNRATKGIMKFIFPEMKEEHLTQFFKYRDDPEKPHRFRTLDDLSKYLVETLQVFTLQTFNEKMNYLRKTGVKAGAGESIANGSLFKVVSVGQYERATYTITAFVSIPVKEPPAKKVKKCPETRDENGSCGKDCIFNEDTNKCVLKVDTGVPGDPGAPGGSEKKDDKDNKDENDKKNQGPLTYLMPRVVEMTIN
ncbi:MAG: general secretion pathway protein GspK [Oligoflexia bacterium]|nr:general secretion pathway protein GspK [Oligoflexia bacterium]